MAKKPRSAAHIIHASKPPSSITLFLQIRGFYYDAAVRCRKHFDNAADMLNIYFHRKSRYRQMQTQGQNTCCIVRRDSYVYHAASYRQLHRKLQHCRLCHYSMYIMPDAVRQNKYLSHISFLYKRKPCHLFFLLHLACIIIIIGYITSMGCNTFYIVIPSIAACLSLYDR